MTRHIIFISGVGDHSHWFYDLVARYWKLKGFAAHAYIFGWDDHASDFDTQFAKLLKYIDSSGGDHISLVGISAGGTAALNAFAARPNLAKVVMVSSPMQKHTYTNELLLESIARAQKSFAGFDYTTKRKLLTITGHRDQVVPPRLSLLAEVDRKFVLGFRHSMSIVMATLIQTGILRRFLTRA